MNYRKVRMFESDIHVLEYDPSTEPSQICLGKPGREALSQIEHQWYNDHGYRAKAKINFGFFDFTTSVEHYGMLLHDSGFSSGGSGGPTSVNGIECYLGFDYKFVVREVAPEEVDTLKDQVFWGASLSYALVIDGQKNLKNAEYYDFANRRVARTMIGQQADGTMVLAVADGSASTDVGLNIDQEAAVMLSLDCVNAINCDGGGSSEIIYDGKVKNSPSDGGERRIGSALLVFEKVAVPVPTPNPPPAPTPVPKLTRIFFDGKLQADFTNAADGFTFGWAYYNAGKTNVYLLDSSDTMYVFSQHVADNPNKPPVIMYATLATSKLEGDVARALAAELRSRFNVTVTLTEVDPDKS